MFILQFSNVYQKIDDEFLICMGLNIIQSQVDFSLKHGTNHINLKPS